MGINLLGEAVRKILLNKKRSGIFGLQEFIRVSGVQSDYVVLEDNFSGSGALTSHTPDTNETGNIYHDAGSKATLLSNALTVVQNAVPQEVYIDLGTNAAREKLTYKYKVNTVNKYGDMFRLIIRSSHSGSNTSGYGISLYNNNEQAQIIVYKITNDSAATLFTSANLGAITLNTFYPIKIIDDGSDIKVYFDFSGAEATTLRHTEVDSTWNDQQELAFANIAYANTLLDNLYVFSGTE